MRNPVIDNLRSVCMLGIIVIHAGSLAVAAGNFWRYVFLKVLSRYSVPFFFFISGYGLFYHIKTYEKYVDFIKERFCRVGIPYLSWSLLYLLYFYHFSPVRFVEIGHSRNLFKTFFGWSCYHLYFMVILIWFYAFFPLWKILVQQIEKHGIRTGLFLLLCFKLGFNYWTAHPGIDVSGWNEIIKSFFIYRLNYLPLHYMLVFIAGALAAIYGSQFMDRINMNLGIVTATYIVFIAWLLGSCLYAYNNLNYTLPMLANTYHQLSLQGLFYTLASIAFFCMLMGRLPRKDILFSALQLISKYSLIIYLIHPMLLDIITGFCINHWIVMTVKKVIFSYLLLAVASLAAAMLLSRILRYSSMAEIIFDWKKDKEQLAGPSQGRFSCFLKINGKKNLTNVLYRW